jgi:hypothetical protein
VLSGGNVGIGTATPQFPLHIITSASTIRYEHDVAGGAFSISGNTGIPRFDIGSNAGDVFSFGIVATGTAATWVTRGKAKDTFVRASAASNGLNIINAAGVTGTEEDYIRFYAGKNADQGVPDLHIHGTGTTRGFVGINVSSPTNRLHVSADTNPVKIEGLTAVSATTKIVATDSNNQLVNFSGTNRSIPYFTTNGVITHSPTFTYNDSSARTLQIDDGDLNRSSTITFGGGRGNITCPSTVTSGLIFQVGLTTPFDQQKSFTFRNGSTNYLTFVTVGTIGGNSAHTSTFTSTVSINNVGITTSNWGLSGIVTRVLSNSYTDATTATTTASETVASSFAIPTFTALTGKTYSALTNVYIAGAPIAGTNVTGLTSYALKVNTGTTYFGGDVTLSGISSGSTTQVLTRQANGNVAFRNINDMAVSGRPGSTLLWYDEPNTPPAIAPSATGTSAIAIGNGAQAYRSGQLSIGDYAGQNIVNNYIPTSDANSIFIGVSAGTSFGGYVNNTIAIGYAAGMPLLFTYSSIYIGSYAGGFDIENFVIGGARMAIGEKAGYHCDSSNTSTFIGYNSGISGSSIIDSIVIGDSAGAVSTNITNSTFFGPLAGKQSASVSKSTFIGYSAGSFTLDVVDSIIIGQGQRADDINNTVIIDGGQGAKSIYNGIVIGGGLNLTGAIAKGREGIIVIGRGAADNALLDINGNVVAIGTDAIRFASNIGSSVILGGIAGSGSTGILSSVLIGENAGIATISTNSVIIGSGAGQVAGNSNLLPAISQSNIIGLGAGANSSGITNSNIFGIRAAAFSQNVTKSIYIGSETGSGSTGNNNVVIGNHLTISGNNRINIGNVLFGTEIYSAMSGNVYAAKADGKIGIGVVNPEYTLDVSGTTNVRGNLRALSGLTVATGTSKAMGFVTLSGGAVITSPSFTVIPSTAVISNSLIGLNSMIILSPENPAGIIKITAKGVGTCDITSSAVDNGVIVRYLIINPA